MPDLSVVIGFRDWGLDRLALALRSHAQSEHSGDLEVIVSDYGSSDPESIEEVAHDGGALYVRTDLSEDEPWSRSRALNAGIDRSTGQVIVTTDSDLLFTPAAHGIVLERMEADSHSVQLLQCRDLPESVTVGDEPFDWREFESNARLRPRWGMGGMVAFPRGTYELLGGLESRMEIYGGEDIDFVQRMRWAGKRVVWIDDPDARIFHIWHPSSRGAAERDDAGSVALDRNRAILLEDRTIVRNLSRARARPVATVAIATHNRASYLEESITSVLANSVENIEVLVVDDGSTDDTSEVVNAIDDPRIRFLQQDHSGVAAARNRAVQEASGDYIVIHDDDDLMLPWRIEAHFSQMTADVHGTYGGWIDFDNVTGELTAAPGKKFSQAAILYTGSVLAHGTLMLEAAIYGRFRYNELLRAGSDYNLALRLASAGIRLSHTERFHILRRLHASNLTDTNYDHQKESARRTTNLFMRALNKTETENSRKLARATEEVECVGSDDVWNLAGSFLPDGLVRRSATIAIPSSDDDQIYELRQALSGPLKKLDWVESESSTEVDSITFAIPRLDWEGLRQLRGFDLRLDAIPAPKQSSEEDREGADEEHPAEASEYDDLMIHIEGLLAESDAAVVCFGPINGESTEWFTGEGRQPKVVSTLTRQYLVQVENAETLDDAIEALLEIDAPRGIGRLVVEMGGR